MSFTEGGSQTNRPNGVENSQDWLKHYGSGIHKPVRFVPLGTHKEFYPTDVDEELIGEHLQAIRPFITFPFNVNDPTHAHRGIYDFYRNQRSREFPLHLVVEPVDDVDGQWSAWVTDDLQEKTPLQIKVGFGGKEFGPSQADKILLPVQAHIITLGLLIDDASFYVSEGVSVVNPFEPLPNGESVRHFYLSVPFQKGQ